MPDPTALPTIGRRVYFWPTDPERFNTMDHSQPFDAGVVFVHPDGTVNLLVTDHDGLTTAQRHVPFGEQHKGAEAAADAGGYADWMPYQKGASHTAAPAGTALLGG